MNAISVRVQAKGQVTIPKIVRKKLNLTRGDLVIFVETEEGVLVKPASVVTDDTLRNEIVAMVGSIRERFADYSPVEIDALVDEAIQEIRGVQS